MRSNTFEKTLRIDSSLIKRAVILPIPGSGVAALAPEAFAYAEARVEAGPLEHGVGGLLGAG